MDEKNEQVDEQVEDELSEFTEDDAPDETDWKALALKNQGIAKRLQTKLAKATTVEKKEEAPVKETAEPKSSDLDYGQKAFLKTYGISGSDELALVKSWVNRTGDDIDALVADDIFQAKLTSLREAKEAKGAIPSTSKRSNTPSSDNVEYWLQKDFSEVPEHMRTEVLNAKISKEKSSGSNFSSRGIVTG